MTEERDDYNDGYTHEALHVAHVLAETLGKHVVETRCADEFPDVKAAALKAEEVLGDLYQLIGTKFKDDDQDNPGDQLRDALSGLLDWVKEDCPDGGRYAITEAEIALRGWPVRTPT